MPKVASKVLIEITIEPVLESDGPTIIKLFAAEKEIWPAGGKQVWYRFWHGRRRAERWDKILIGNIFAGFVHWSMRADNTRTIYDMLVVPRFRHLGYGRQLIEYVGAPTILKTTHSHAFYEALDFIKIEETDGKALYFLDKQLTPIPNGPWILTYTGKIVNPLDLKSEDICIEDIAHALACVNRFAGHTAKPISVAQHSVCVSRICDDSRHRLQGLLHNASEAYLGDVTKWVKEAPEFALYRDTEERVQRTIYEKFHCDPVMSETVARADRAMVLFEAPRGFGKAWSGLHLVEKPGYEPVSQEELDKIGKWAPWNWRVAEEAFLVRYRACLAKNNA